MKTILSRFIAKKEQTLALVMLFVVLLAGASWLIGRQIQSPAEAAARTAPPAPSPILVPVEERLLTSNVITRGTARYSLPQSISLAPSPLKGEVGIITTLPAAGDQLTEGDVLFTTSGRPVFLLQGSIPMYRDLYPGLSGEDVRQLEAALQRLSFAPGPVDGVFDEKTAAAILELYKASGYSPFTSSVDHLRNFQALEEDLTKAIREKAAAENTLSRAMNKTDETAVREAEWQSFLVERLTQEVAVARALVESPLPMDEIVYLPNLPVRVEEISVEIGKIASGPILVVTNNQLAIDSSLPLSESRLIKEGFPVTIDEPELGIDTTGTVAWVAETPGTNGVDSYHTYFEVLVDDTPTPLEGYSLRLTIPVKSTGHAVMVVPISALFLAPDGTSRVQVENNGTIESITVEPGLSADGFVEIIPIAGELAPGQMVLIGYDNAQ